MWKFAFRNLLNRPIRSLLALLGLTVAIAGMVGLFSVAEGLDNMVDSTFDQIPGLVVMQPGAPIPLFSRIPAKWEAEISDIKGVGVVNFEVWSRVNLINGKSIVTPPRFLFGTDIERTLQLKKSLYRNALEKGRFLDKTDQGTYNTVISRQIAEQFDVTLGESFEVNGFDLTVVGIYHFGNLLVDVAIIMDIDQVRQMGRFDKNVVSSFYVEPDGTVDNDLLAKNIRHHFRNHSLDTWSPSASAALGEQLGSRFQGSIFIQTLKEIVEGVFEEPSKSTSPKSSKEQSSKKKKHRPAIEVRSASDWADKFKEFSGDLDIILTLLTSIGMTIAVLSIINTMLMSVD